MVSTYRAVVLVMWDRLYMLHPDLTLCFSSALQGVFYLSKCLTAAPAVSEVELAPPPAPS